MESDGEEARLTDGGTIGAQADPAFDGAVIRERQVPAEQRELQMGHRQHESVGDIYAPFLPEYLNDAVAAIEAIIDDIETRAPKAFHRSNTGTDGAVVPLPTARKA